MSTAAQDAILVDVARQAEAIKVADVHLAQACNAKLVPYAQR
jgi:hypothetical protein